MNSPAPSRRGFSFAAAVAGTDTGGRT